MQLNFYLILFNLMSKMFLNIRNVAALAVLGLSLTVTSCAKEKGCMTVESDNYNAAAEEDSGLCEPWRAKFLGAADAEASYTYQSGVYKNTSTPTWTTMTSTNLVGTKLKLKAGTTDKLAIILDYNATGVATFILNGKVNASKIEVPSQQFQQYTYTGMSTYDSASKIIELELASNDASSTSIKIKFKKD